MKKIAVVMILFVPSLAIGQSSSLSSTMDVYVFPKAGQEESQQSQDEAACYDWAVEQSGNDPFELAKQEQADAQQAQEDMAAAQGSTRGAGARGALRGAAAGAVIGEIADDDAGKGAAYGAAAGTIASRRKAKRQSQEAQQQVQQQAETRQEATADELGNFKKAFSVCLEAKDYMVKY